MFIRINYNIYNIYNIKKIKYKKMLMDICVSSLFTIARIGNFYSVGGQSGAVGGGGTLAPSASSLEGEETLGRMSVL